MSQPSILIVGAGPSGLVLALVLLQNGVPVRIIDKERTHRIGSRAAGVMARTQELYAQLGVLSDILAVAGPFGAVATYDFGEIVPKSKAAFLFEHQEPTPDVPYPNTEAVNQTKHEGVLRAHLAKLGCTVELAAELRGLEQSGEGVLATIMHTAEDGTQNEETAAFEWLVGTDGAHSVVRKQLGLSFLGETRKEHLTNLGDIVVEEGLGTDVAHMWFIDGKMILVRPDDVDKKMFSFMCRASSPEKPLTREHFVEDFYRITGRRDVKFGEAAWLSKYTPNIRMVDTMRKGRVFVAGDAAHCHTPAGGQGLNSSVQDAANLGWKLALVHRKLAPASLLDTYAEERMRIIAHMLGLTTALGDRNRANLGKKDFKMKHPDAMRMLGVNYRGSSIVCEEPGPGAAQGEEDDPYMGGVGGRVQAAYRAPDASELEPNGKSTKATKLFEVFSAARHTVLVFGGDAETRAPVVKALQHVSAAGVVHGVLVLGQGKSTPSDASNFAAVLEDRAGHAYKGYGVDAEELAVVVVRPDGVVGVVASDAGGVERYFKKILIAA
ncbi:FAD binding domain-containing protein [Mycena metata]|uniref:FAD binding domain-containing protein n=1 Tax=Mycena metata TaxID=1033252 RepID=A0AAD7K5S7_9AGAR|nr:FAD binding domain-containing protein [Mycena metata]